MNASLYVISWHIPCPYMAVAAHLVGEVKRQLLTMRRQPFLTKLLFFSFTHSCGPMTNQFLFQRAQTDTRSVLVNNMWWTDSCQSVAHWPVGILNVSSGGGWSRFKYEMSCQNITLFNLFHMSWKNVNFCEFRHAANLMWRFFIVIILLFYVCGGVWKRKNRLKANLE